MSFSLVILFVITAGLIWVWNGKKQQKGKAIPGPRGLPIVGNILQIGKRMAHKFAEWADEYGDMFKVQLGSREAIVISDPKLVKEIFTVEPAFAGRAGFEGITTMYPEENLGIVLSEGELWEVHRRFLLRQLRDFGFGKSSMEQLIIEEVNQTIGKMQKLQKENKKIDGLKQVLLIAVVNSLFTIAASKRWEHDDKAILTMLKGQEELAQEFMDRFIFILLPWTRKFLPKFNASIHEERDTKFYVDIVNEHKETYKEGTVRDFVDVYLAEMKKDENNPTSQFYGAKAERQLHKTLQDLHTAGSDTTSTTLTWAVLYLCTFPEAQKRLQKEISELTGDSRQVSISDRPQMPYTLALIDEILRYSSLIPLGVQHSALFDKEFKGHLIKKGTWLFPNLHYIHKSKKIWGDPTNFRPERFLSKDGKYQKNENLMPFQIGRRQCVGETLARDSVFLYLTNLFQKFEFSFDPDTPQPDLEPHVSFQFQPKPYSVILKERI